jgi:hypothetical protein
VTKPASLKHLSQFVTGLKPFTGLLFITINSKICDNNLEVAEKPKTVQKNIGLPAEEAFSPHIFRFFSTTTPTF